MDSPSSQRIEIELKRALNLGEEHSKEASAQVSDMSTDIKVQKLPKKRSEIQVVSSSESSGSLVSPRNLILLDNSAGGGKRNLPGSALAVTPSSSSSSSVGTSQQPQPSASGAELKKKKPRTWTKSKQGAQKQTKSDAQLGSIPAVTVGAKQHERSYKPNTANVTKRADEKPRERTATENKNASPKQMGESKQSVANKTPTINSADSRAQSAAREKQQTGKEKNDTTVVIDVNLLSNHLKDTALTDRIVAGESSAKVVKDDISSASTTPITAKDSTKEDPTISAEEEAAKKKMLELESEHIFLVNKKAQKQIPKYLCRLCDVSCIGLENCDKHLKDTRHKRLKCMRDEEQFLRQLPPPTVKQDAAVTKCIMDLCQRLSADDEKYKLCEIAIVQLQNILNEFAPKAVLSVYGSAVSGFMLSTSDLNVDIKTDDAPRLLNDLLEKLRVDKSGVFRDLVSDFTSEMPVINVVAFSAVASVTVNILVNNSSSVETSKLLAMYSRLDPRVQPLAIALRYWAKICKVDIQAAGTLPAYAYGLIVVYYLQQCKPPVLPVLNELLAADEKLQCLNPADVEFVYLRDVNMVNERWHCENERSVGWLWIDMLRYLAMGMDTSETVVCIRQKALLRRSEKKWMSKRMAIEDPFYRKRNIARSLSHSRVHEFIDDRLRAAYKYFAACKEQDDDMILAFDEATLGDKKGPALICSLCMKDGHSKINCPRERLPPLHPLPPLTRKFIDVLNCCLSSVPGDFEPREKDLRLRHAVLTELQSAIRRIYPNANLCLFGSSCNGFGFAHSDLDITLTFEGSPTADGMDCIQIIETLAKSLRKQNGFYHVQPITTAKVPIVKFIHARSKLEGDISLYNTLAQHNTRMLQTYALIDSRVKILGYVMKVFAKCACICDASRGSLSSYAYILMVIYYLQQRKPPVLPVLQELCNGNKSEVMVDKWNAWFFEDLKTLPTVWPGLHKNKETIAELWVGLLRFYTEEFRFNEHVICIRRLAPLTKFEKLWNRFGIAIEDPFNLQHNLGTGVSRKMNGYIQKVLRKGRKLFGTPIERLPSNYDTFQNYFFDTNQLTDEMPPNDRGCRRCGKVGHFVNECPQNGANRPKKQEQDDDHRNAIQEKETASTKDESQGCRGWWDDKSQVVAAAGNPDSTGVAPLAPPMSVAGSQARVPGRQEASNSVPQVLPVKGSNQMQAVFVPAVFTNVPLASANTTRPDLAAPSAAAQGPRPVPQASPLIVNSQQIPSTRGLLANTATGPLRVASQPLVSPVPSSDPSQQFIPLFQLQAGQFPTIPAPYLFPSGGIPVPSVRTASNIDQVASVGMPAADMAYWRSGESSLSTINCNDDWGLPPAQLVAKNANKSGFNQ